MGSDVPSSATDPLPNPAVRLGVKNDFKIPVTVEVTFDTPPLEAVDDRITRLELSIMWICVAVLFMVASLPGQPVWFTVIVWALAAVFAAYGAVVEVRQWRESKRRNR